MQLSDHDLKQLDEEYLRSLPAEPLRALSSKLLSDLKEAHDQLNQNPSNSSRPPSTRAPWENAEERAQDGGEVRVIRISEGIFWNSEQIR